MSGEQLDAAPPSPNDAGESTPAASRPSSGFIPPLPAVHVKDGPKKRRRWTVAEIDGALTIFRGNRKLAAEKLGMTVEQLKNKIDYFDFLKLKWSRTATIVRAQVAETNDSAEKVIDRLINEQHQQLSENSVRILQQLKNIEARITKGEEAALRAAKDEKDITEEDKAFIKRHALRFNKNGDPIEEQMLRNSYAKLLEEFRREHSTCVETTFVRAKIAVLMRKAATPGTGRAPAQPGFRPKMVRAASTPQGGVAVEIK